MERSLILRHGSRLFDKTLVVGLTVESPIFHGFAARSPATYRRVGADDYKLTLEKAKAALAMLDQRLELARAEDAELKFKVKAAEASVDRAKAELRQAGDTLELQPTFASHSRSRSPP